MQSTRNGSPHYTSYEGMSVEVITGLLTELGCTDIAEITEETFIAALPII